MCNAEVKFKKGYTHYQTFPCWKQMLNMQIQETLQTSFPLREGIESILKTLTFPVVKCGSGEVGGGDVRPGIAKMGEY